MMSAIRALQAKKELITDLVWRELRDRHAGQSLGVAWAYGQVLFLVVLYTFLFSYIFPTRYQQDGASIDFSVNVLAGIVSWLAFQDLLGRASGIFLGHANLVKQIVFPVAVLPLKTTLATVIPHAGALVFAVGYAGWHGTLSMLSLALPFIVLCQLLAMIGIAFLLASVGVFFKDLRDIISVLCTINLFAQPILYNPFATPEWLDGVFHFNPFSYLIWCWQDALFYGYIAHPVAWIALPIGSLATLVLGWKVFQNTKQALGDAL